MTLFISQAWLILSLFNQPLHPLSVPTSLDTEASTSGGEISHCPHPPHPHLSALKLLGLKFPQEECGGGRTGIGNVMGTGL